MSTPEQASNWGGSSSGEQKKKQPPFWEREIKVGSVYIRNENLTTCDLYRTTSLAGLTIIV